MNACKDYTRLERLEWDTHSSLFCILVNYSRKKFYKIVPEVVGGVLLEAADLEGGHGGRTDLRSSSVSLEDQTGNPN
jgi:hypothetical protein